MTETPTHAQTLCEDFDKRQRHATSKPGRLCRPSPHGVALLALCDAVPERRQRHAQFMIDLAMVVTLTAFVVVIITIRTAWNLRSEWIELRKVILERAAASDTVRTPIADDRALLMAVEQIARAAARWEADMDQRGAAREGFRTQMRREPEQPGSATEGRTLTEIFGGGKDGDK